MCWHCPAAVPGVTDIAVPGARVAKVVQITVVLFSLFPLSLGTFHWISCIHGFVTNAPGRHGYCVQPHSERGHLLLFY